MSRPAPTRGPGYLDDYVGVHTRIEQFYGKFPEGRILTELLPLDGQPELICFKAFIYRDRANEQADATGHSIDRLDLQKSTFEKLETAAVGRALAMLGFEVKKGIASREEIEKAERAGQAPPLRSPASPDERCEATARQPVSVESAPPQGTIIPNQLEWLKDRLGANLDAASEERFGRPARALSLQDAGDWIKELGKSKLATPATTHNAPGFHFEGAVVAKTMADLVTPKQLIAIRAIANATGLNAETECLDACKCRPEELSRTAASAFIDFLKSKTAEAR